MTANPLERAFGRPNASKRLRAGSVAMAFVRKMHAWCGLALCLLLVPLCLSGAALVFKPQWLQATVPEARPIAAATAADAADAMTAAEQTFGQVRRMIFAGPEIGLHEVALADQGAAYIQPGTHRVLSRWGKNGRVVDFLFDLHHHFLAGETGTKVAGVVGLLTLTMVMTGLIVWAPAWRSFRASLAPRGAGRAAWLGAHRDLGLISAPIIVALTLTGSALALREFATHLLRIEPSKPPAAGEGRVDWGSALAAAQAAFPSARLRLASPPARSGAPVTVRLQQPGEWHANGRTVVYIDPATTRVLAVEDPFTHPLRARIYNAAWPVHASKVGGLPWKVITFLAGVCLAVLSLYGAESYRRKLFKPRRS